MTADLTPVFSLLSPRFRMQDPGDPAAKRGENCGEGGEVSPAPPAFSSSEAKNARTFTREPAPLTEHQEAPA